MSLAPGSMGTAYIEKRTRDGGYESITLPDITSIDSNFNVSLTELSTIIFGYANTFCMDMGNSLKISVTCKRANPFPYNDSSTDPTVWSNGKWYRHLESFMDYWQNLGLDIDSDTMVGGFRFHFVPSDPDAFPEIDRNVFLSGALNLQYSTTYMVVQMNLQVARMQTGESGTDSTVTVTLHLVDPWGTEYTYEAQAALNFSSRIPNCPNSWDTIIQDWGGMFVGWCTSSDMGSVDYREGDPYTYTGDMELWAMYSSALSIAVFAEAGTYEYAPPLDAGYLRIFCVGGGGGAGNCSRGATHIAMGGVSSGIAGGAGAGGDTTVVTRRISRFISTESIDDPEYPRYRVVVGAGGARGDTKDVLTYSGTDGHDGEESYVEGMNSNGLDTVDRSGTLARGGKGGKGGPSRRADTDLNLFIGASGGESTEAPGGSTQRRHDGEDGVTTGPNIIDNVGKGFAYQGPYKDEDAPDSEVNTPGMYEAPGAGGGAAAFRYRFIVNGQSYPENDPDHASQFPNGYYESYGGDGGGLLDAVTSEYRYATAGRFGGGGGSGSPIGTYNDCEMGEAGGDGIVIVVAVANPEA